MKLMAHSLRPRYRLIYSVVLEPWPRITTTYSIELAEREVLDAKRPPVGLQKLTPLHYTYEGRRQYSRWVARPVKVPRR